MLSASCMLDIIDNDRSAFMKSNTLRNEMVCNPDSPCVYGSILTTTMSQKWIVLHQKICMTIKIQAIKVFKKVKRILPRNVLCPFTLIYPCQWVLQNVFLRNSFYYCKILWTKCQRLREGERESGGRGIWNYFVDSS